MSTAPTASVIIPVYRVEAYLARCIDSVLAQDEAELEIILVDDGSPDTCPQICDSYARRDDRIRVIHKANGGLSSARNAGLRQATGRYVFFLDSDDWIDPHTIRELVAVAEARGTDFVRFRPMYANWPGRADGSLCDFGTEACLKEGLYRREDIEAVLYPRLIATPQLTLGAIVSACRSLYRRSFLTENGLEFDEGIRYSEDTLFSAQVVRAARSFYYLDGARYYHYFYNKGSITKSFRPDRWESCKRLMAAFEAAFGGQGGYNFSPQLHLLGMYCALSALGERKAIVNWREREAYCAAICRDEAIVRAFRHLHLVSVRWKLKLFLTLIRWNMSHVIAII